MLLKLEEIKSHVVGARTKQKPCRWCKNKTKAILLMSEENRSLVEFCSNWFFQSCCMDFSKLYVGFVKIDIFSKLLCGFVKNFHVFLAIFKTKPSWSLITISKLVDASALGDKWVKILNAFGLFCLWQCFNLEFKTDYIICNLSTVLKDAASEDLVVISTEDTDKDR